jgi:TorA maturation chaperone TorD
VPESEDHIAFLCEVMRRLIEEGGEGRKSVSVQRQFFAAHLEPWVAQLCAQLVAHPAANLYVPVARFAETFFEIEKQAFELP